jgi:hypothetical protein
MSLVVVFSLSPLGTLASSTTPELQAFVHLLLSKSAMEL